MSDTKSPQDDAPTQAGTSAAIVAAIAIVSVLLFFSVASLGNLQAKASSDAPTVPEQSASPEAHSAFIREGHTRAALEGEDAPLPPTF